jgi:hypothetical protein
VGKLVVWVEGAPVGWVALMSPEFHLFDEE